MVNKKVGSSKNGREQKAEELLSLLEGGLDAAIQADGQELLGFSCKIDSGDCLLTLRVDCAKGRFVAFVGADCVPSAVQKAHRLIAGGDLVWRADKYAR